mgnify:FL=1
MPNFAVLITLLVYISTGLSFALVRGCATEVHALERQSEKMKHGITGLRDIVNVLA